MINLSQQIHKRMLPKGFIKRLNMLIGSKAFSKFIYRKIKNKQTKNQKEDMAAFFHSGSKIKKN